MKFQWLIVYVGDYGRREGGGLRLKAHYEHNKPVKYECWVEGDKIEKCEKSLDFDYLDYKYGLDDMSGDIGLNF